MLKPSHPTTKPPTPPMGRGQALGGGGTIGRAGGGGSRSIYGSVAPVAPPMTPPTVQQAPQGNVPTNHGNHGPSSGRASLASAGSYSPSNTLVMGQVHHPGHPSQGMMGQPGGERFSGQSHSPNSHYSTQPHNTHQANGNTV